MSMTFYRRAFLILLSAAWLIPTPARAALTALDRYVAAPDPAYGYKLVNTIKGDGQTTFVIEMTSQSWLTEKEVNRTVWKHWLSIIRPDEVKSSKALLMITGGSNEKPAPKAADANLIRIARSTHSVVVELKMVPNQPLVFAGETKGRVEDGIIAYSWDKYLRSGDERWPARLPMTKAAVRAMDTVVSFLGAEAGNNLKIDGFVVAGASKRGWTTWTTAIVDKRVVAIIPIVIDMLNIEPSFIHHFEAYGFFAPAVGDYMAMKIMDWTGTPEYHALMKIEEPYEYLDRLTMPKFMINASGDQFFLPDSAQFYFKDLPGTKYLRYIPNADHSLKGSDAVLSIISCYQAILNNSELPKFDWEVKPDGSIDVVSATEPSAVLLWQATNPNARDFRLETIGPKWQDSDLKDIGSGRHVYHASIPKPAQGWTAYFVELTFPSGNPLAPYKFTTEVRVIPDVLPFKFVPKANGPAKQ